MNNSRLGLNKEQKSLYILTTKHEWCTSSLMMIVFIGSKDHKY